MVLISFSTFVTFSALTESKRSRLFLNYCTVSVSSSNLSLISYRFYFRYFLIISSRWLKLCSKHSVFCRICFSLSVTWSWSFFFTSIFAILPLVFLQRLLIDLFPLAFWRGGQVAIVPSLAPLVARRGPAPKNKDQKLKRRFFLILSRRKKEEGKESMRLN